MEWKLNRAKLYKYYAELGEKQPVLYSRQLFVWAAGCCAAAGCSPNSSKVAEKRECRKYFPLDLEHFLTLRSKRALITTNLLLYG